VRSIEERVDDATVLWEAGRYEGAFLLAIVALIARARQDFPKPMSEGAILRRYIESRVATRLSVEYRGTQWPIEDVFYKWFRCEIVHAGDLPVDIELIGDSATSELSVRAGGAPDYRLLVSRSWFHQFLAWARE
jgi:hypothetical protein